MSVKNCRVGLVAAALFCAASVADAEWSKPLSDALGGAGELTRPSEDCAGTVPCVRLWSQMSAKERAKLWPYLDDVSRSSYWREMSRSDRKAMKRHLCERDKEALRHRFSLSEGERRVRSPKVRPATEDDRSLMRRQIMEVHMELTHPGAPHGSASRPREAP